MRGSCCDIKKISLQTNGFRVPGMAPSAGFVKLHRPNLSKKFWGGDFPKHLWKQWKSKKWLVEVLWNEAHLYSIAAFFAAFLPLPLPVFLPFLLDGAGTLSRSCILSWHITTSQSKPSHGPAIWGIHDSWVTQIIMNSIITILIPTLLRLWLDNTSPLLGLY